MSKLSKEEIQKVANLAKIKLTDKELDKYAKELSGILDFVSQISEVDVSDIEYASHVDDFEGNVLREDKANESLPKDKVFQPDDDRQDGNYFKTSKVL